MKKRIQLLCSLVFILLFGALIATATYANTINVPSDYSTISVAISAASTNDIIIVDASGGPYTESLVVSKSITLRSTNNAEIDGVITISANNVNIEGLIIKNPSGFYGITATGCSNLTIKNNTIDRATNAGIYIKCFSSNINNISITGNTIKNISSGSCSTKGILIGDSNGNKNFDDVAIQSNNISSITSCGHGACGILINHSVSPSTGKIINLQIKGNTINNLDGLWAHAIGLEGNTPSADLESNIISNVIDHKTPTDAAAINVEDNPGAGTLAITSNSFSSVNLGIQNKTTNTVNAANNTYGAGVSTSGPVTALAAPTNLSLNGVKAVSFTPTLGYDAVTNNVNGETVQYTVQLSPESNFSHSYLYRLYNINTNTFQTVPSGRLNANTTYYWRVKAETKTTLRKSAYVTGSFTTKSVSLREPGNAITGVSLLPTFQWDDANVSSYTLKIGTRSHSYSISVPISVGSNATSLGGKVTNKAFEKELGPYLKNNTKYYWTVTYTDNSGNSQTFNEFSFATVSNINLALSNPSSGSTLFNYSSVMFAWVISTVTGNTNFELQICKNSTTPSVEDWADNSITETFFTGSSLNYTLTGQLDGDTTYYWRVIVRSTNGKVVKVSNASSFTTAKDAITTYPSYQAGN